MSESGDSPRGGEERPRGGEERPRSGTNVLAAAIVVAGGLVGLGLFMGLRAGAPAPGAAPTGAPQGLELTARASAPVAEASATGAPVAAPSATADASVTAKKGSPEKAVAEAKVAALAQWRGKLKTACWDPLVAKTAEPKTSTHRLVLGFDASGKEVARGVSDVRDKPSRTDVGACLRTQTPTPISVAAPGEPLQVEVELTFP